ncbi:peptidase dimerization domain protein [Candidatus Vecturithrix granuli]|uniref:Peptidase dimerization domain protein n=1 Tax=Vecturithrix granuli TaxID=1499967 RepID=A0A081BYN3_VECG1|nr:peptidase dimerization domain protein [Candidatus Vecturithrix granuli]
MSYETFEDILAALPSMRDAVAGISELLLANLVLIGEIAAPTFHEQRRVEFLKDRFIEGGLLECSIDEKNNIYGVLPGETGKDHILIVAHLDTDFPEEADHTINVRTDSVIGAAVADNSLGIATIATLPIILDRLGIRLQSNLILMGAAQSLGRGDLGGLRFFLANKPFPIKAGIGVEGVQLGRLSHSSIGMLRGEINCTVPEESDWTHFGETGAILILNEIINHIVEIPIPIRPQTVIILGSISGGTGFEKIPTESQLQFEIRSESAQMVSDIRDRIEEITLEVSERTNTQIKVDFFARREPGGIPFSHPLCRQTRKIIQAMDVEPQISPSISELPAFIDHQIPAIAIGITRGERLHNEKELIYIPPVFTGIAQLIGILLAIDGGFCDEN